MKNVAEILPVTDRMALVAAAMITDAKKRIPAIAQITANLKLIHPHFFWNEDEIKELEALWDIQRRERNSQLVKET
jgi:hypothetical protein